ncbi:potassium-transporting ATPase subunit KdpC [Heyndrickxia sporothermodurans]|uniref:potassium-transporting ATPase subunit KdpC n=1 Tax=Heyndrickxia TaxID=2837504 RepID=UPI000D3BAE1E|nr:potassium-transporting ATPase subunit KdpC [Heyndrickxia sporothermodurans]MEB6549597.1 potassium-transporting ATPase subunit KdpC [Heyndrickxia sporothermodurans]PTY78236.1 potassium-transporting ATPase subunit C [Heyndrickxia sporothermodurans]
MKMVRLCLLFILLCGLIYPLVTTAAAQLIFPKQAKGSLVYDEDNIIGSELIAQQFTTKQYFHGRISSIQNDGAASGSTNYAPSNKDLLKRVKESIDTLKRENPGIKTSDIPLDLITNSGSGLDPEISIKAAEFQISRVSKESGISEEKLHLLINQYKEKRSLGLFGEPRINVLTLNLALMDLLEHEE